MRDVINSHILIAGDFGKNGDTFTFNKVSITANGLIKKECFSVFISSKERCSKINLGVPPSTSKTGELKDNFRSTNYEKLEKYCNEWVGKNSETAFENQSDKNLKRIQHSKSAEQRYWQAYAHKILEYYLVDSFDQEDRDKYSKRPRF